MKDYYAILGLQRNASLAQIRAKYRFLAKELHPDHGGNLRAFQDLQEAYATLGNPQKRRAYDLQSKIRQFVPQAGGDSAFDLMGALRGLARTYRVPEHLVNQVAPVVERKLQERGVDATAVTAQAVLEAAGWLKPMRRKRA